MDLTDKERARWNAFKKQCREKDKVARVKRIIEMAEEGATSKQIYSEVKGAHEVISATLTRARRRGEI